MESLAEWEGMLECGLYHAEDGHILTLRETKAAERKVERINLELRQRKTARQLERLSLY